jgi:hypothetical protein
MTETINQPSRAPIGDGDSELFYLTFYATFHFHAALYFPFSLEFDKLRLSNPNSNVPWCAFMGCAPGPPKHENSALMFQTPNTPERNT